MGYGLLGTPAEGRLGWGAWWGGLELQGHLVPGGRRRLGGGFLASRHRWPHRRDGLRQADGVSRLDALIPGVWPEAGTLQGNGLKR